MYSKEVIDQYIQDIKDAKAFMINRYGDTHFLRAKNGGRIPSHLSNLQGSTIKGFNFHGRGCTFSKKTYNFDVEFDLDSTQFGISAWNLYRYASKRTRDELSEEEALATLESLSSNGFLTKRDDLFYLPQH